MDFVLLIHIFAFRFLEWTKHETHADMACVVHNSVRFPFRRMTMNVSAPVVGMERTARRTWMNVCRIHVRTSGSVTMKWTATPVIVLTGRSVNAVQNKWNAVSFFQPYFRALLFRCFVPWCLCCLHSLSVWQEPTVRSTLTNALLRPVWTAGVVKTLSTGTNASASPPGKVHSASSMSMIACRISAQTEEPVWIKLEALNVTVPADTQVCILVFRR